MIGGRRQLSVGLDVGLTQTKLVVLEKRSRRVQLLFADTLDQRSEGILGEDELGELLEEWLGKTKYANQSVVTSLPQYLTDVQLIDFPVGAGAQLEEMVNYETQQFAGLSDENFIHDYQSLAPFSDYRNPVIVGLCREAIVRRKATILEEANIRVRDMTMEGIALANACLHLRAEIRNSPGLTLLLDMGAENTTYVVLEGGQIASMGSVPFGGDSFTQMIRRERGLAEEAAEQAKCEEGLVVDVDEEPSATMTCANEFVDELTGSLEHWYYQRYERSRTMTFQRTILTGGGSQLKGLSGFIAKKYQATAEALKVPAGRERLNEETLTIAYGLALQGFEAPVAPFKVSLAPHEIVWRETRRRRSPFLVASVALLAFLLFGSLLVSYLSLRNQKDRLLREQAVLDKCEASIPQLVQHVDEIKRLQTMMQVFAARGNRNRTFVDAVRVISKYQEEDDWLVSLADEMSYYGPAIQARQDGSGKSGNNPINSLNRSKEDTTPTVLCETAKPWRLLIASGFTPRRDVNKLGSVRITKTKLDEEADSIFTGVDVLVPAEQTNADVQMMTPWLELYRMKPFALRLPLRAPEFEWEASK